MAVFGVDAGAMKTEVSHVLYKTKQNTNKKNLVRLTTTITDGGS